MHDDGYDSPSCSRRGSLASNTDFRRRSSLAINENAEIEGNDGTIRLIVHKLWFNDAIAYSLKISIGHGPYHFAVLLSKDLFHLCESKYKKIGTSDASNPRK